jgi:hypothetical protein
MASNLDRTLLPGMVQPGDLAMALADVLQPIQVTSVPGGASTSVSRDPCPGCDTALIDRQHLELERRFIVPKLFAFSAALDYESLFGRAPDPEKLILEHLELALLENKQAIGKYFGMN